VFFVKVLLGIALASAVLFFLVLNLDETVDVKLWVGSAHTYRDVPLGFAMLVAYLLGVLTYFIIALVQDVRMRTQVGRLRRENRTLNDELHHLRGSALDDLPTTETRQDVGVGEGRAR